MNAQITIPTADELDTGAYRDDSGWGLALYLVPETGEITTYQRIGSGMPEPAFKGWWITIAEVPPGIRGAYVAEVLTRHASDLAQLAEAHRASEWRVVDALSDSLGDAFDWTDSEARYWDASDYYQDHDWPQLCAMARRNPRIALIASERAQLLREVVAACEADAKAEGASVAMINALCSRRMSDWLEDQWFDERAPRDDLQWHTRPQDDGQIVMVSYAMDTAGRIWTRTIDQSDPDRVPSYEYLGDECDLAQPWEPWHRERPEFD